jgi:hypothetical protein
LRTEGHAAQDVLRRPGQNKLIYPEVQRYRGLGEEISGLEDEARQVKKSRGL